MGLTKLHTEKLCNLCFLIKARTNWACSIHDKKKQAKMNSENLKSQDILLLTWCSATPSLCTSVLKHFRIVALIPYKLTFGTRNCKFFSSEPPHDAISIMNPLTHLKTNSARLVHQATVISWNQKLYGLFHIWFKLTTESGQMKPQLKKTANHKLG